MLNNMAETTQNFNHMIIKSNNKNARSSKITVREGDMKQEIYNW